jgi:two-component system copper resistance phosphate regulon response regulator CusR
MRLLLVEDEVVAARLLAKGLRDHAYAVDVAADGASALTAASVNDYDVIVLDLGLPDVDGLEVCRSLREQGVPVPVLMLTARDAVQMRIAGLDSGADDYLTKPFDLDELLARLRALLRRGARALVPERITVGPLILDTRAQTASCGDVRLPLTTREYAFLEFLARHAGEVVGRSAIAEHVWDDSYDPLSNVIDVYVQRLRRKLALGGADALIKTRRGAGYLLSDADQPHA